MTRRNFFNLAAAGLVAEGFRARGEQASAKELKPLDTLPGAEKNRKLKVVFVGAHVDDWIFCVGTLARYAREGHDVVCLSFTPGDSQGMADAKHMPLEKLAALRRDDAMRGTKLFGATLKVLDQHNQKMHVDPESYDEFNKTLAAEKPDIVFGLWPLQYHPDHRAGGEFAFNAWLASGMAFAFYFCETWPGSETTPQLFVPDRWIDVESVRDLSRRAIVANTLEGEALWADYEMCTKFRGRGYGCQYAEAFVHIATVATADPQNIAPRRWFGGGLNVSHDK